MGMETPGEATPPPGAPKPGEGGSPKDDPLVTIAGGVDLEVAHADGSKETVKVRQIPVSKISQFAFATAWGQEAQQIALYCDKPLEWADTLTVESVNAIANIGQEINLPFYEAWQSRQAKWKGTVVQVATGDAGKALAKAAASPSTSSAPPSPTSTS